MVHMSHFMEAGHSAGGKRGHPIGAGQSQRRAPGAPTAVLYPLLWLKRLRVLSTEQGEARPRGAELLPPLGIPATPAELLACALSAQCWTVGELCCLESTLLMPGAPRKGPAPQRGALGPGTVQGLRVLSLQGPSLQPCMQNTRRATVTAQAWQAGDTHTDEKCLVGRGGKEGGQKVKGMRQKQGLVLTHVAGDRAEGGGWGQLSLPREGRLPRQEGQTGDQGTVRTWDVAAAGRQVVERCWQGWGWGPSSRTGSPSFPEGPNNPCAWGHPPAAAWGEPAPCAFRGPSPPPAAIPWAPGLHRKEAQCCGRPTPAAEPLRPSGLQHCGR